MSIAHVPAYTTTEWYSDVPRSIWRIGLLGLLLMGVSLGGFGYWAFTAPLAAAVVSQGSFVATGRNKVIQHFEGGIIEEILVEEGEVVAEGQTLLTLDRTAAETRMTELELRRARLIAMSARLNAEYDDQDKIEFSTQLLVKSTMDADIREILDSQRMSFTLSREKLNNDLALINANIDAQKLRIWGYEEQRIALEEQVVLLQDDLESKTALVEEGLARKSDLNALERAVFDGQGQIARLYAEIGESESQINKYKKQALQAWQAYNQAALDELQAVQSELDSVQEQFQQAENVLRRTQIVAPVAGTVLRLNYHTTGGVIQAGKGIAEILPLDAPLIIETLIPRTDIDSVQVGQYASVRLVALNQRTTPVLDGEVYYVSADAIPDAKEDPNREVYIARISLHPTELTRVKNFSPTPGMPAEILITTQERTFMQYLTKPIVDSMSRAFRED
ncbi:MAG: HlyD family type I secretion periplasmic adaptor subunit [Rhodobacter sp.]|nr:HlyD family type I secretion periplasmic adaptor subunit [Rhodobacter sp.]